MPKTRTLQFTVLRVGLFCWGQNDQKSRKRFHTQAIPLLMVPKGSRSFQGPHSGPPWTPPAGPESYGRIPLVQRRHKSRVHDMRYVVEVAATKSETMAASATSDARTIKDRMTVMIMLAMMVFVGRLFPVICSIS